MNASRRLRSRAAWQREVLLRGGHEVEHLDIGSARSMAAFLRRTWRSRPDVIHCIGGRALIAGRVARPLSGSVLVYDSPESIAHQRRRNVQRVLTALERGLLGPCVAVLAPSQEHAENLVSRHPRLPMATYLEGARVGAGEDGAQVLTSVYAQLEVTRHAASRTAPRPRETTATRSALLTLIGGRGVRTAVHHPIAAAMTAYGLWLQGRGHRTGAAVMLSRASRLAPEDEAYALRAAGALKEAGHVEQATAVYRRIIEQRRGVPSWTLAAAAINLARLGARAEAQDVLQSMTAPAQVAGWAGQIHIALGNLDEGRALLPQLTGDGADMATRQASLRILEQTGEPTRALETAEAIGDATSETRLRGTLRSFDPTWLPRSAVVGGYAPVHGRVLNLLEASLPHARSGYAYRTVTVVRTQRAIGLDPINATRLGFPASRGVHSFSGVEIVDGVVHHRLVVQNLARYTSVPFDRQLEHNLELLVELALARRPAFVQAGTPHLNGLLGLGLREALGIPLLYDVRGFPEMTWAVRRGGGESEAYRLRRVAETRCMREADMVATLSDVMREQIVGRGVPPERVRVLPHVVDLEAFGPRPRDESLAARYGLEERRVVGYVSSLVDYEGIEVLIDAIAQLGEDSRAVLLLVGDGPMLNTLRRQVDDLGIEHRVVFAGRVPHEEVAAHYGLMDVFVCPRLDLEVCRFVMPLKPFEAMAMERCVVASDLPVFSELTGKGTRGVLFPAGDAGRLAAVLAELLEDTARRAELGARAREHVRKHHSPAALQTALRETVTSLLGEDWMSGERAGALGGTD